MIVPLVFLLSPYLRLHRVQSCREVPWITVHSCSPVSCPVLSPDPSPYQPDTRSSGESHVDTPFTTPMTKAYCPFCLLTYIGAEVHAHTYTQPFSNTACFIHQAVLTLVDPSGSIYCIVNHLFCSLGNLHLFSIQASFVEPRASICACEQSRGAMAAFSSLQGPD